MVGTIILFIKERYGNNYFFLVGSVFNSRAGMLTNYYFYLALFLYKSLLNSLHKQSYFCIPSVKSTVSADELRSKAISNYKLTRKLKYQTGRTLDNFEKHENDSCMKW